MSSEMSGAVPRRRRASHTWRIVSMTPLSATLVYTAGLSVE
jgi:hypothetical protein